MDSSEFKRTYSAPTDDDTIAVMDVDETNLDESSSDGKLLVPAAVSSYAIKWTDLVIGAKLGSGAFGDVKKAVYRDTPVAVKMLHSSEAASAFFQEAALLCQLRHPNIVSCLGVCIEEPYLAIVMELMPSNLNKLIQQGPLPIQQLTTLAIGIGRGLAFLHQRSPKVIHRDIKPENILIDAGGNPKLADFGVSKEALISMTQTKIGTPSYAAPELLQSEPYGTKIDIYSLSMVLYSMATGVAPFASVDPKDKGVKMLTPLQIMMKVAIHKERPVIPNYVHPTLATIIRSCWEHNPKSRPTASQLLEKLLNLQMELDTPSAFAPSSAASLEATVPLTSSLDVPSLATASTKLLVADANEAESSSLTSSSSKTRKATKSIAKSSGATSALKGLNMSGDTHSENSETAALDSSLTSGSSQTRKRARMGVSADEFSEPTRKKVLR